VRLWGQPVDSNGPAILLQRSIFDLRAITFAYEADIYTWEVSVWVTSYNIRIEVVIVVAAAAKAALAAFSALLFVVSLSLSFLQPFVTSCLTFRCHGWWLLPRRQKHTRNNWHYWYICTYILLYRVQWQCKKMSVHIKNFIQDFGCCRQLLLFKSLSSSWS